MAVVYGGNGTDSLTSLRHFTLTKKIVSSTLWHLNVYPYCVLHQTPLSQSSLPDNGLDWEGDSDMDVLNWNWKLKVNQLIPVMSDMNAAPWKLLQMIHSKCETACRTPRCSMQQGVWVTMHACLWTMPVGNLWQSVQPGYIHWIRGWGGQECNWQYVCIHWTMVTF